MTDLQTYEIRMHLSGRLTQLPDSQKIFGALVYLFARSKTPERASEFVAKIKDESLFCAISDMVPFGYLPTPQAFLFGGALSPEMQGDKKLFYKEIKKREYIKREKLEELLNHPASTMGAYPYVRTVQSQQIHASIDSLQFDCPGLEPNLYSLPEITMVEMDEAEKPDKKGLPVSDFSFYLTIETCEIATQLMKILNDAKSTEHPFILGPRASQGLNIFTIQSITSPKLPLHSETHFYLNMGMLLPKNIDFQRSFLALFTSERRPYHQEGGWDSLITNRFISFVRSGSLLYLPQGIQQVGRSIPSPFDDKAILFGNAFLYPLTANCLFTPKGGC